MIIIGIDPGQAGGFAMRGFGNHSMKAWPMPKTEADTNEMIESLATCWDKLKLGTDLEIQAYLEKVHSMPGQGVSSTFKFGKGYGFLRGVLTANRVPFEDVTPRTWQSALGMKKSKTESKTEWKNRLKAKAQQLFPHLKITLATADAILICEYGHRLNVCG